MKKLKFISLAIALVMVITTFVGCGKKDSDKKTKAEKQTAKAEQTVLEEIQEKPASFPTKLTAQKLGSIDKTEITTAKGGVYYKDSSGKYGIISPDGKTDTGAKYGYIDAVDEYFSVTTTLPNDSNNISALNCFSLVDCKGTEIIPDKYLSFEMQNERYLKAFEITSITDDENEAIGYFSDSIIVNNGPEGNDIKFKGNWYVYDVTTGRKMAGVSGTKPYITSAIGGCVSYVTDDEEKITVNAKGERISNDSDLFYNGYYSIENYEDDEGTVYDSNGHKAFTYNLDEYSLYPSNGDYFVASHSDKYVLMDKTGKVVSSEFSETPEVCGELVLSRGNVYDFKGNVVISGSFDHIYLDKLTQNAWLLEGQNDEFTLINADGSIICQSPADSSVEVTYSDGLGNNTFTFSKEEADTWDMYYSLKDKNYTIKGRSFTSWLIQTLQPGGINSIYDIVDSISGETIIKGYEGYYYIWDGDTKIYIYAQKADDGGYDVFEVK